MARKAQEGANNQKKPKRESNKTVENEYVTKKHLKGIIISKFLEEKARGLLKESIADNRPLMNNWNQLTVNIMYIQLQSWNLIADMNQAMAGPRYWLLNESGYSKWKHRCKMIEKAQRSQET